MKAELSPKKGFKATPASLATMFLPASDKNQRVHPNITSPIPIAITVCTSFCAATGGRDSPPATAATIMSGPNTSKGTAGPPLSYKISARRGASIPGDEGKKNINDDERELG